MGQETKQPEPVEFTDDWLKLHRHRYKAARREGMSPRDAKLFALELSMDIGEMRALSKSGCPAHLLLRIL